MIKIFTTFLIWIYYAIVPKENIIIVKAGSIDDRIVQAVAETIKDSFDVNVTIIIKDIPNNMYDAEENSYLIPEILCWLDSMCHGCRSIAITDKYLTTHIMWPTFFYGYGEIAGKACAITTKGLDKDRIIETQMLALHELGHTYGLQHHMNDPTCYMCPAGSPPEWLKYTSYCKACKKQLDNARKNILPWR